LAPKYSEIIQGVVNSFTELVTIELEGVFASPDGITIQGYFVNKGLSKLRDRLRDAINEDNLDNLELRKYKINTAHVAFVKFHSKLNGVKLLEVVGKLRTFPLGTFRVNELVLNISPRYDKVETIDIIKRFSLIKQGV